MFRTPLQRAYYCRPRYRVRGDLRCKREHILYNKKPSSLLFDLVNASSEVTTIGLRRIGVISSGVMPIGRTERAQAGPPALRARFPDALLKRVHGSLTCREYKLYLFFFIFFFSLPLTRTPPSLSRVCATGLEFPSRGSRLPIVTWENERVSDQKRCPAEASEGAPRTFNRQHLIEPEDLGSRDGIRKRQIPRTFFPL